MTDEQRTEYGIDRRMPKSIDEAITALENDDELTKALADGLVKDYVTMKKEEQKMLAEMSDAGRRLWLIERY